MKLLRGVVLAFVDTWRAMLRDAGALMLLFAGGLVYSFFYPLPYSGEAVQRVPVAVVDQDRSALSRQLVRYAAAHPQLALREVSPSLEAAQHALWSGEAAGVLFIPPGLQSQVSRGQRAEVQLAGNGVYMLLNKTALNGLAEIVGTVSAGIEIKRLHAATPSAAMAFAQRQPVGLNAVALFNVREGYGSYIVPGVAVMIVQQTLLMATALLWGTWVQAGRFPVPRDGASFIGLWLAFASVAAINSAYYFGFVMWWQDYPRGGNPAGLLLFIALFALSVSAVALWLASWFRTRERSAQLLLATALPMLFLSGLSWPVEAMPGPLQLARWLLPSTAGIQGFVALNQMGASLREVQPEMLALLAIGAAAASAAWLRWKGASPPA